jgi:hypothetical protein
MAYNGDLLHFCPAKAYDFSNTYAVVVSGDTFNPCDHLILNLGGRVGMYFHVAGVITKPRLMSQAGYERYMEEHKKTELKRFQVQIANKDKAMKKLEELMSKTWLWGVLPHNCASFVEEIVQAGGSAASLYSNCPALESFD